MYSIFVAWKYAKLWTEGYDWRDVLKEPRERMFFDVIAEWVDNVRALWDPSKRTEVRERERGRRSGGMFDRDDAPSALPIHGVSPKELSSLAGSSGRALQDAQRNRDEILRLIETLPKRERKMLGDVPASAVSLYRRIESLAMNLAELERTAMPGSVSDVETEIRKLESEANPLDTSASEGRVRRLAYLKRQRRVVADLTGREAQVKEKLESCLLALQTMRLEMVRLRSGPQNFQTITSVAEKAMALGREVDAAMYARDEMAKLNLGGRG